MEALFVIVMGGPPAVRFKTGGISLEVRLLDPAEGLLSHRQIIMVESSSDERRPSRFTRKKRLDPKSGSVAHLRSPARGGRGICGFS